MNRIFFLSLAIAGMCVVSGALGTGYGADQSQDAYNEFNQKVVPLQQQLFAKQAELDAEYAAGQPDMETVRRLYREMGELKAQLFSARSELRNRMGDEWGHDGYGMYRGGCGGGGRGYMGHHGGHGGGYGGHRGGRGW